jgi:hypothetical protein
MEIKGNPKSNEGGKYPILQRVLFWMYIVLLSAANYFQLRHTNTIWRYTDAFNYFCGQHVFRYWYVWLIATVVIGILLLPGLLWSIQHRRELPGMILMAVSLPLPITVIAMAIAIYRACFL